MKLFYLKNILEIQNKCFIIEKVKMYSTNFKEDIKTFAYNISYFDYTGDLKIICVMGILLIKKVKNKAADLLLTIADY